MVVINLFNSVLLCTFASVMDKLIFYLKKMLYVVALVFAIMFVSLFICGMFYSIVRTIIY